MSSSLQPLQSTLDSILSRLSFLEAKAGVVSSKSATTTSSNGSTTADDSHTAIPPSLAAYDDHIESSLQPFIKACSDIEPLKPIGANIHKVWMGIRTIILIGTKCKKPTNIQESLMPHLKPVQDAMTEIRTIKLDRKYDWHIKAIMEMLVCASWVIMTPPTTPTSFVKDTIGSSDFWSNKIRKEYKGTDEKHVVFCDTMKKLIVDLSNYVKEYHLSGLMWNNVNGVALEEYSGPDPVLKKKGSSTAVNPPAASAAPAAADIVKELAAKRTSDGSSAATGLKKVSRDQQTWRQEYKATKPVPSNSSAATVPISTSVKPSEIKAANQKKDAKAPVCKFQSIGSKWIVENQTKTSNPNGVCVVEVQNPKEQVYIYNCQEATIQIKGKLKGVILDSCKKSNLVFDTAISSCEVVNCKSVQIQSTGICPSFAIDKTDGCLIYLSEEAVSITNFVTSKSTEMNVSWPDENSGEQKEAPIPEQFIHRLKNGVVTSEVSDLYH